MTLSRLLAALCIPAAVTLAGCLGGGGDATPATPAATVPEDVTISGVAATGAPLSGATINVYDAKNAKVASTVAAADGSYTLVVPSTATAPFVIEAVRDDVALYSPVSSTSVTRVNVTPITTIAAAQLSPTGDPAKLAAELGSGAAKFDSAGSNAWSPTSCRRCSRCCSTWAPTSTRSPAPSRPTAPATTAC
jgi:hypothetical protein